MACAPRWHDTVRFDIRHRWGGGVVLVVTANHSSCSALFLPLMADGLRCDSSLHAASTGALARIYSWGAFWSISVWRRSLAFSDEDGGMHFFKAPTFFTSLDWWALGVTIQPILKPCLDFESWKTRWRWNKWAEGELAGVLGRKSDFCTANLFVQKSSTSLRPL